MLSAIMFFMAGLSIGLALWSGIIQVGLYYMPVYYVIAAVALGFGVSLRRYRL